MVPLSRIPPDEPSMSGIEPNHAPYPVWTGAAGTAGEAGGVAGLVWAAAGAAAMIVAARAVMVYLCMVRILVRPTVTTQSRGSSGFNL